MTRARYPKECPVFEVVSRRATSSEIKIGTHVEAAGPCCVNTGRMWKCGVLVLNGYTGEDEYQWTANLRPLTPAARAMLKIARGR